MKRLDIDTLLDEKKQIYVKNNALKSQILLVIQLKDKNGRNQTLKVPPTELPVHVSAQFSADSIRESSDLRRLLYNGTLLLVEPSQAARELDTPEAREQLKSLSLSVYADSAPTNAVRDNMERLARKSQAPVMEAHEVLSESRLEDQVSLKVKGLIASFMSKEKSSKDALLQLKRMKPALTEHDLTYIISNCKTETTIREFAESSLAELHAAPEQPFDEE